MRHPKLLAYAQLLRLPNVFTAFADIALAGAVAGIVVHHPGVFALLLTASGCLYLAGMVFNDYFDRHADARTQPFRPIPSGRVSATTALVLATVLMLAGAAAALATARFSLALDHYTAPAGVVALLILAILLYNAWLKWTPFGPLGMGACRFLNVLLGLSGDPAAVPPELGYHLAGIVGLYIVGVTWFARTEETESRGRTLALAALVKLAAVLGVLLLPLHRGGQAPWFIPYLVVIFLFLVGTPVVRAIRQPEPKLVQAAVKRSILGLVVLDAILAAVFVGWPGLAILLLLIPALVLGKWVYST
jgi:4-hydroxybenzoate polyprenyltransferase